MHTASLAMAVFVLSEGGQSRLAACGDFTTYYDRPGSPVYRGEPRCNLPRRPNQFSHMKIANGSPLARLQVSG